MKPNDVTSKMVDVFFNNTSKGFLLDKEIIAAAFNAVVSDDSPITAEWLVANGYENSDDFFIAGNDEIWVEVDHCQGDAWSVDIRVGKSVCTVYQQYRRQLICLLAGLGIGEVK